MPPNIFEAFLRFDTRRGIEGDTAREGVIRETKADKKRSRRKCVGSEERGCENVKGRAARGRKRVCERANLWRLTQMEQHGWCE